MDIFESLENLHVSEGCFDEIMGIVEELLSEEDVYELAAHAKDGYNFMATGSNKLNGKLYKVHTKHDKGVTKTKLYAKDGDSARKLVQKAYGGPDSAHTLANESLYNEIADLVEAILSENIYDAIDKKYGEGKNVNLRKKAISNAGKEMSAAWQRDAASSGSSDLDKRISRALEINRAQKRFGDGKSIHMEQERQLERGKAKPITNEIGKAIIKGTDEFDKAHKEAVSASRLSRKADKKVKGAFDNAGYMTDKYSDPKDADKAWDTAQDLSAKRQAALNKLTDVNKKQKENAKYAKYVKYAGSVPNKTGSGVHSGIKHS